MFHSLTVLHFSVIECQNIFKNVHNYYVKMASKFFNIKIKLIYEFCL